MLGKMLSKTLQITTLPARAAVRGSLTAMESAHLIPGGLQQFQKDMLAVLDEVDASYDRRVNDMTEQERELSTVEEIKNAEHHLAHAMISILRLVKLAIADDGRVIEHRQEKD